MWNYYVVEGNKRVSVLKYFGAPAIRAEVTRLIPQLDKDTPGTAVYYAFLRYDKEGLFKNIELTTEEKYAQLRELEVRLTDKLAPDGIQPNYNSMLIRFDEAFAAVDDTLPVGDAFLEYLKVYGFMRDASQCSGRANQGSAAAAALSQQARRRAAAVDGSR